MFRIENEWVKAVMALSNIANIVEIFGVLALVSGIAFGLLQFRQNRLQRRDLAVLECARMFEDEQFTENYRLLSQLESGLTMAQFEELGDRYEAAALRVGMKFETVGLLVHRGVVPISAMEDLVGGAALTVWRVIEQWVAGTRKSRSNPNFWEWYQWLAERLEERGQAVREPAFIAHARRY